MRIVTTDWCASNQAEYFGATDLAFTEVPDLLTRPIPQAGAPTPAAAPRG